MAFMMMIPIIGFILVLLMILIAVKNKNTMSPSEPRSSRDAMKILDERFAKGEIDEAEYVRKKTVLKR